MCAICLPILLFSSASVEGSCPPWCFDILTCGFHYFLLITMVGLTPISLFYLFIFVSIWFWFSSSRSFFIFYFLFFCGCLCGLCATDLLSSVDRIFCRQLQRICWKGICVLDILCAFFSVFHLWSTIYVVSPRVSLKIYWWNWLSIDVDFSLIGGYVCKLMIVLPFILKYNFY